MLRQCLDQLLSNIFCSSLKNYTYSKVCDDCYYQSIVSNFCIMINNIIVKCSELCPDQIGRNPGLQAIWEDEKQRRRENNQVSQLDIPDSQGEQIIA